MDELKHNNTSRWIPCNEFPIVKANRRGGEQFRVMNRFDITRTPLYDFHIRFVYDPSCLSEGEKMEPKSYSWGRNNEWHAFSKEFSFGRSAHWMNRFYGKQIMESTCVFRNEFRFDSSTFLTFELSIPDHTARDSISNEEGASSPIQDKGRQDEGSISLFIVLSHRSGQ